MLYKLDLSGSPGTKGGQMMCRQSFNGVFQENYGYVILKRQSIWHMPFVPLSPYPFCPEWDIITGGLATIL